MKTTLEIPDELFRQAKAKAAIEGRKLKDVVVEGLQHVVNGTGKSKSRRVELPLLRAKGKRKLDIANDAASRFDLADEMSRYAGSLRQ